MKTRQLFFFTFLVSLLACSQTSNEFNITGHIEGVQDGGIVLLHKVEGRVGKLFMQDTIRDGRFSFKGEEDSLQNIKLTPMGEKYPIIGISVDSHGVYAIPFYVLISPDGIIEKIWMGYETGMFEKIVETIWV